MATGTTLTAVSTTEAEREFVVRQAIHSGEMEGLTLTAPTRHDADLYVQGDLTADDLVERARARHGL